MRTLSNIILWITAAFASNTMAETLHLKVQDSIKETLITSGLCKSLKDCAEKKYIYSEHSNGIYLNFYKITEKRHIAAIASTAVNEVLSQEEKIPLILNFYEKDHEEYTNIKSFFKKPLTTIKVE